MPTCRKCGNEFPANYYKGGLALNLRKRKFCLDCLPYRRHNTRGLPDVDNGRSCKVCGAALLGTSLTYCKKCGDEVAEENKHSYPTMKRRRKKRKEKLIELMGGKCQICGYDKCTASLVFHHVKNKSFHLSKTNLSHYTWDEILEEAKKCQLLCMNCHAELHYPDYAMGDES